MKTYLSLLTVLLIAGCSASNESGPPFRPATVTYHDCVIEYMPAAQTLDEMAEGMPQHVREAYRMFDLICRVRPEEGINPVEQFRASLKDSLTYEQILQRINAAMKYDPLMFMWYIHATKDFEPWYFTDPAELWNVFTDYTHQYIRGEQRIRAFTAIAAGIYEIQIETVTQDRVRREHRKIRMEKDLDCLYASVQHALKGRRFLALADRGVTDLERPGDAQMLQFSYAHKLDTNSFGNMSLTHRERYNMYIPPRTGEKYLLFLWLEFAGKPQVNVLRFTLAPVNIYMAESQYNLARDADREAPADPNLPPKIDDAVKEDMYRIMPDGELRHTVQLTGTNENHPLDAIRARITKALNQLEVETSAD